MKKLLKGIVILAIIAAVAYFGWNWWASKNENVPPVDELVQHFTGGSSAQGEEQGSFLDNLLNGNKEQLGGLAGLLGGDSEEAEESKGLGVKDVLNLLGNEKIQEVLGEVDVKEVLGSLVSGDGDALAGLTEKLENISLDDLADMGVYDIDEQSMFDAGQETFTQELSNVDLGTAISVLHLNVGGGMLQLTTSVDEHFYLSGKDYGKLQYSVEDGILHLVSAKSSGDVQSITNGQVILAIPVDADFSEISLELGAGAVKGDSLTANELQLNLSMGSVDIRQLKVQKADINVSMGDLKMNLVGEQSDYDYKVSSAMGKVLLGSTEYSGAASGEKLDNGTGRMIDLECSIGNITLGFTR